MFSSSRSTTSNGHGSRRNSKSKPSESHSSRRLKTQSAQSYETTSRRSSNQTTHSNQTVPTVQSSRRPGFKSRAFSAPQLPKDINRSPPVADQDSGGEPGYAEEIAEDPFFQRYDWPQQSVRGRGHHSSRSSRENSSDTEGPLSPRSLRGDTSTISSVPSPRTTLPVSESHGV